MVVLEGVSEHTLSLVATFRKVWFSELMVFCVFFTTMLVWPGLVTQIPTYNFPSLEASSWWSLLLLFCFSLFDCLGRYMVPYR